MVDGQSIDYQSGLATFVTHNNNRIARDISINKIRHYLHR